MFKYVVSVFVVTENELSTEELMILPSEVAVAAGLNWPIDRQENGEQKIRLNVQSIGGAEIMPKRIDP
jgi:invasion protein IalB